MKKLIKTKIKKVFSSILPLAFLFVTMFPGNIAQAAWSSINVLKNDGTAIDQDVKGGSTVDYTGRIANSAGTATSSAGKITYADDVLTLEGIDLTTTHGLIDATAGASEVLTIKLVGDNKITSSAAAIKVTSGSIKFTGDGSLTITQSSSYSAISTLTKGNIEFAQTGTISITATGDTSAITTAQATDTITVTSGTLSVNKSGQGSALESKGLFKLNGGTVSLTEPGGTSGAALSIGATCDITGGSLTIDQQSESSALESTGAFSISAGHVDIIQSGTVPGSATEAALVFSDTATVKGGSLTVSQSAAQDAIWADNAFSQTGGSINVTHTGDSGSGLYFSNTAQFNGGTTSVTSTSSDDAAILSNNTAITIDGGVVHANSSMNANYGITAGTENLTVTRGVVEGHANTAGIDTNHLVLGDYTWTVYAGQNADSVRLLTQTSAADVVSALKAGGYDYVRIYNASTLAPATSVFDKNTAAKEHTEITVGLDLNGNKLTGIYRGSTELTSGKEFHENIAASASDPSSVTFQVREFLDTLPVGTHTLTFTFDNSTTADFTLEVVDTTSSGGSTQTGDTAQSEGSNQAEDKTTQSDNTSNKTTTPKTGDESNIMLYVMLLTAGLFSLVLASKKKLFSK